MQPKINYVALLILIILGVAVGNLTSSLIASKYINNDYVKETPDSSEALSLEDSKQVESPEPENSIPAQEIIKLSLEEKKELEIIEKPIEQKLLIEERKLDENGIRLAKKCNEWTIVHKDMNTQTSEKGMNKHCNEYYDYLSFGNLPSSN